MLSQFRHTGLVVEDLQRACDFYLALGFQEVARDIETGYFIDQVTGIDGARLEWVKLNLGDGVLLELLNYHTPGNLKDIVVSDPKFDNNYPANLHGCSHIAYTTPDIRACCAKIVELGGAVVNPPAQSPNGKVLVAYAFDLDGILMEIVQELSSKENVSG